MSKYITDWISALSSLIVCCIAIWTIFFSPASEALVGYLQTELSSKNKTIENLEVQKIELDQSVQTLKERQTLLNVSLRQLGDEHSTLVTSTNSLRQEKEELKNTLVALNRDLSKSNFSLVRSLLMDGTYITKLDADILNLTRGEDSEPSQKMIINFDIWSSYLSSQEDRLKMLDPTYKKIGSLILKRFIIECSNAAPKIIHFESDAIKYDEGDFNAKYAALTLRHKNISKLSSQLFDIKEKLQSCQRALQP